MLTRRSFLIDGVRIGALLASASRWTGAFDASDPCERVLVVLQLGGGNDALNMVVPHAQDAYYRARPTIAVARGGLQRLDDAHGLHPKMRDLARTFDAGRIAVVHGVGLPAANRSHFRAMEIWHSADPDGRPGEHGWLGRIAETLAPATPGAIAAIHVGDGEPPLCLRSPRVFAPTLRDADGLKLHPSAAGVKHARQRLLDRRGEGDLAYLRETAKGALRAAERMQSLVEQPPRTPYPDTELGRRMRLIARLIDGEFGARIFHVELGGFDTHARQTAVHERLLEELSGALAAFQRELDELALADRVLTMVFSEFGRRVAENGSRGTDHGAGAPVLLVGGRAVAGLHGVAPDLSSLVDGDVPSTTDFRAIYATLERDWLALAPSSRFEPLVLVRS